MASSPPIPTANQGRANVLALGILAFLVLAEAGLSWRVLLERSKNASSVQPAGSTERRASPLPTVNTAPPVGSLPTVNLSPPAVGQLAANPSSSTLPSASASVPQFGPPPVGSLQMSAPATSSSVNPQPAVGAAPWDPAPKAPNLSSVNTPAPTPLSPPPASTASAKRDPASGMTLAEMLDLARQVRGLGDMQGALEVLKRADLQFPASPEVLTEIAQSYETMGLTDQATSVWKQLAGMDPSRAGGYGDLAMRKLGEETGVNDPALPTGSVPPPGEKALSLGACTASRDPSSTNAEKVVLRVPIRRVGTAAIDPAQVDIDVFFFDRVNGEKVAQTIADEPLSVWSDQPVDWSGSGEEPLEVTYFLPNLTPGEVTAHGRRAYHGYVVRLYYQDKLQDVAAEPRDLLDFGAPTPQLDPATGVGNPLLPPVAN